MADQNPREENSLTDNVRLDGEHHTTGAYDQEPFLALNFDGKATIKGQWRNKSSLIAFVPSLNSDAPSISEEIKREIRNSLPHGLDVSVDIQFSFGSVEWLGVVAVLDAVKNINTAITFAKFLRDLVEMAVNKIVRQRIEPHFQIKKISTNVTSETFDPVHRITRFLWWCSGGYNNILRVSPTESAKHIGLGGAVLTTGVLACLSGGYAIYTMFEGRQLAIPLGLLFGPIWGLIIFNLDRFIVSTMKKEAGPWPLLREFPRAVPRFILAFILAVTISKPLELAFFAPEINARIQINNDLQMEKRRDSLNSLYSSRLSKLENERNSIEQNLETKSSRIRDLQDQLVSEMNSTGGSRKYGYSTVAKRQDAELQDVKKEFNRISALGEARVKELQSESDSLRKQINEDLEKYRENLGKGLLARGRALSNLTAEDTSVRSTQYLIIALLLLIEAVPVGAKLMSSFGPYDSKLSLMNEAELREAEFKRNAVVKIADNHFKLATDSEMAVEKVFYEESTQTRSRKVRQAWQQWDRSHRNGQGSTYEEFVESIKKRLFLYRKP